MNDYKISIGNERSLVQLDARFIGEDVLIAISGGTRPHIGAVATAIPHPSPKQVDDVSASVSVHALVGHKEDELARETSDRVARALNRTVVVTAGIHIDMATLDEITLLVTNARKLVQQFLSACA